MVRKLISGCVLAIGIASCSIVGLAQAESMEMPKAPAPPSTSLTVTVDGKTTTFSVTELSVMPQKIVKVHNEHTKADETYSGVPLGDLLTRCGFKVEQATHRKMLRSFITAEGTDKYWVVYSADRG